MLRGRAIVFVCLVSKMAVHTLWQREAPGHKNQVPDIQKEECFQSACLLNKQGRWEASKVCEKLTLCLQDR